MPTTERPLIDPLGHDLVTELVPVLRHASVGAYLGGPAVTTLEAMHAWIDQLALGPGTDAAEDHWWNWAVRRRDDGQMLGYVQATGYVDWAEIAYVFGPSTGGHGYATEAVRWLMAHLADGGRRELWAAVHPANEPSRRLLDRVGFRQVNNSPRELASFDDGDLVFLITTAVGSHIADSH